MLLFSSLETALRQSLQVLASHGLPLSAQPLWSPPHDLAHGDLTTSAAMVYAKSLSLSPKELGSSLMEAMRNHTDVAAIRLVGPGFLNVDLKPAVWETMAREALAKGDQDWVFSPPSQNPIHIEIASANPTGPLHLGHGRITLVADAIARLLEATGHHVFREYYVNDAGGQAEALAYAVYRRYRQTLGLSLEGWPESQYPGDYLQPLADTLIARDQSRWADAQETWKEPFRAFAVEALLKMIEKDLDLLGAEVQAYRSEKALHQEGKVEEVIDHLEKQGAVKMGFLEAPKGQKLEDWTPLPLQLFHWENASGDIREAPLTKTQGGWTYLAGDMAYHMDKMQRGFSRIMAVWGADHDDHVARLGAGVQKIAQALKKTEPISFEVYLCQMVHLLKSGVPFKMSKRAGTVVEIQDIVALIGSDAFRYSMLAQKPDSHLNIDVDVVREKSQKNPLFYNQYAQARCASIVRMAQELFGATFVFSAASQADLSLLSISEWHLIKKALDFPRQVMQAALVCEPHRLVHYVTSLSEGFHQLWSEGNKDTTLRFLVPHNPDLSAARLALVQLVSWTSRRIFRILGLTPVEELHG